MADRVDWIMVRIPRELKARLEEYGLTVQEYEPKQQGNHEDNHAEGPPLWRTIERLLALEKDHKKRSSSNSVRKRTKAGIKDSKGKQGTVDAKQANKKGSVYTECRESNLKDLPGQGKLYETGEEFEAAKRE